MSIYIWDIAKRRESIKLSIYNKNKFRERKSKNVLERERFKESNRKSFEWWY